MDTLCPLPLLPSLHGQSSWPCSEPSGGAARGAKLSQILVVAGDLSPLIPDLHLNRGFAPSQACPAAGRGSRREMEWGRALGLGWTGAGWGGLERGAFPSLLLCFWLLLYLSVLL